MYVIMVLIYNYLQQHRNINKLQAGRMTMWMLKEIHNSIHDAYKNYKKEINLVHMIWSKSVHMVYRIKNIY